jgi:hypothetical protein
MAAATVSERQTYCDRREAQGAGATCVPLQHDDFILEKQPDYHGADATLKVW